MENAWKTKDEARITCPCCKKLVIVRFQEKTIAPAVPAEKEERIIAEPDIQKKLIPDDENIVLIAKKNLKQKKVSRAK